MDQSQANIVGLLIVVAGFVVYFLLQKKEEDRLKVFVRQGEIPLMLSSSAYTLRTVRVGNEYESKTGNNPPITFVVLHIEPELLAFEIGIPPEDTHDTQGRWEHRGWTYEIPWFRDAPLELYSSALKAAQAMERRFLEKKAKVGAFA